MINKNMSEKTKVAMVGCFDTKAEDFAYLHSCLTKGGAEVVSINTGVLGSTDQFPVNFEADKVAEAAELNIAALREANDRGEALIVMGKGAGQILGNLFQKNEINGVIGMGGGGGTFVAIEAMKTLPFGVPKLCLSTLATKDLSEKIEDKDIVLMLSIVDVAGLNRISRVLINQAAGAILGMANMAPLKDSDTKGSIALSVFGNTTVCANRASEILKSKGYDVLAFHAVGTGGKTMESLMEEGVFDAVLDLTTTELADELCGGICSAGPHRLKSASKMGLPQVVVPGCIDMVNFAAKSTVPEKYQDRHLFSWAPDVTLMRTNKEENDILGRQIAERLNSSKNAVTVVLPLNGLSKIGAKGEVFYDAEADKQLFKSICEHLDPRIKVVEVDVNVNTPEFAEVITEELLLLLDK